MTFSVDVDFWPFQAGPPQDATARQSAGEGRGKDFASSLFGISADTLPSADLFLSETGEMTLTSLSLLQTPPALLAPPSADGVLAVPVPEGEILPPEAALDMETSGGDREAEPAELTVNLPAGAEIVATRAADEGLPESSPVEAAPETSGETETETPRDVSAGAHLEILPEAELPPASPIAATLAGASPALPAVASVMSGVQPAVRVSSPEPAQPATSLRRAAAPPAEIPAGGETPDGMLTAESGTDTGILIDEIALDAFTGTAKKIEPAAASTTPVSFAAGSAGQTVTPGQTTATPAPPQLPTTHAIVTTTPAQLPEIVARATSQGKEDSILVQLDPPELGRVSIDFKFDTQGLQHVIITAESPEAMRQLRQMHFELLQALERNGLSGQSMSFQHQNPQQNEGWGQPAKPTGARFDTPALTGSGLITAADSSPTRQAALNGRLDIRL